MRKFGVFTAIIFTAISAFAATGKLAVIHTFTGEDGASPYAGLTADSSGNLYGTTQIGGTYGFGSVFRLTPEDNGKYQYTELYVFTGGPDGGQPLGSLIFDANGNGYGTAAAGGDAGVGVVYELSRGPGGAVAEKVLYSFQGGSDGELPFGNLVFDAAGNLYGTTSRGGVTHVGCFQAGCGTIYELSPNGDGTWSETILHEFSDNFGEGAEPRAGLVADTEGNLYGTTNSGGNNSVSACNTFNSDGCGTVFELTQVSGKWELVTLVDFNFNDGAMPQSAVTLDGKGNLYGTATKGGRNNGGVVFAFTQVSGEWEPVGALSLTGQPYGNVIVDDAGNIYGTTYQGGANDWGSVYELSPRGQGWVKQTLYSFPVSGPNTGASPFDGLLGDGKGNFFLTTGNGGNLNDCEEEAGCGTVIEFSR